MGLYLATHVLMCLHHAAYTTCIVYIQVVVPCSLTYTINTADTAIPWHVC